MSSVIDRSKCADCGYKEVKVHWGFCSRCQTCSDVFVAKLYEERKAKAEADFARYRAHVFRRDEDGNCPDDGELCSECCPHDEFDHGICLGCETDFSEDMAAAAYDRAKDLRKYGDT